MLLLTVIFCFGLTNLLYQLIKILFWGYYFMVFLKNVVWFLIFFFIFNKLAYYFPFTFSIIFSFHLGVEGHGYLFLILFLLTTIWCNLLSTFIYFCPKCHQFFLVPDLNFGVTVENCPIVVTWINVSDQIIIKFVWCNGWPRKNKYSDSGRIKKNQYQSEKQRNREH